MKYALSTTDMNKIKARITEQLVKRYIEKVLTPALREQGWSQVIFEPRTWFDDKYDLLGLDWKLEQRFFIDNGLYPTEEFLAAFKKLTKVLENLPDGFLIKLRKTKRTKLLKEALAEFGLEKDNWRIHSFQPIKRSEYADNEELPIVEGEIEIVEVKTGKAILPSNQMISYGKALQEKYVLRFFHVNIISFEKNIFEIEEKLVTNTEELETVQKNERKRSAHCNQ